MTAVRTALRARLEAITGLDLPYLETSNMNPPAADRPATGFVTMDFPGGTEAPASIGHAGANLFRNNEVAQIHVYVRAGTGEDVAVAKAEIIRAAFRNAKILTDESPATVIRVYGVDPPATGPGSTDGRFFRATIAFDYWYDVLG